MQAKEERIVELETENAVLHLKLAEVILHGLCPEWRCVQRVDFSRREVEVEVADVLLS